MENTSFFFKLSTISADPGFLSQDVRNAFRALSGLFTLRASRVLNLES